MKTIIGQYGMVHSVKLLPPTASNDRACLCELTSLEEAEWIYKNLNGNIPQGLSSPVTVLYAGGSKGVGKGPTVVAPPGLSVPSAASNSPGAASVASLLGLAAAPSVGLPLSASANNRFSPYGVTGAAAAPQTGVADLLAQAALEEQQDIANGGAPSGLSSAALALLAAGGTGYGAATGVGALSSVLGGLGGVDLATLANYQALLGAAKPASNRPQLPVTQPTEDIKLGTFSHEKGQFGFIKQDSGDADMFVLPQCCEAFGRQLPAIGTRVTYKVVRDAKTGRPRADSVQPAPSAMTGAAGQGQAVPPPVPALAAAQAGTAPEAA
eukprot:TRINITY_DN55103_c0_g1_i1.p1 TRINITY_DN55103_c0_g1~~TRINITY_DN55103_c0_g1_i1.p1  ORF type:complete len:376 (-),score=70.98 TRINITY_DN55103_c0_g1_i1:222-1196(-)